MDKLKTFTTAFDDNPTPIGDGLLRINWYNGDPKQRTPGAFFVSQRRLEANGMDAPEEPWRKVKRTFNNGKTEEGYAVEQAWLQVIGMRKQNVVLDADGYIVHYLPPTASRGERPEGWSVFVEVLLFTPGIAAPVVWSSKRIKTSMAIITMMRTFKEHVIDAARKHYNNPKIPFYAFWLYVKSATDEKGNPVYEKTRGTPVTPPALVLPNKQGEELFKSLYVGNELLEWGEEQRRQYDDWLKQLPGDARVTKEEERVSANNDDIPF